MKKAVLPKKEWASYQLALAALKWTRDNIGLCSSWSEKDVRELAKEIRKYRNEERTTN
jgi:hypothetical protein